VGNRTKVKIVKNKVAPPFREVEFDIIYGEGISAIGELVDMALDHKLIAKSGSWYSYGDIRIGQGRDATKDWLRDNTNYRQEITDKIKSIINATPLLEEAPEVDNDEDVDIWDDDED
jgi:recombination protein RecA